jgi:putative membrane protein
MKLSMILLPLALLVSTFGLDKLTTPGNTSLSRAEQKFLIKMADARMVNFQEGQIAFEQGANQAVKEYGKKMMADQTLLMNELKKIAASKNFELPETLSDEKERWMRHLKMQTGNKFDEKFIKMMVIDHRKDVKYFRMATRFNDPAIRVFASNYLPLIESHFDSANRLNQ